MRETASGKVSWVACTHFWDPLQASLAALENRPFVGVDEAGLDELPVAETQLVGDLADLGFFVAGDGVVGRRYGEEAVEQLVPLLVVGDLPKFAGHQIILGAAEEQVLVVGDGDDQHRLLLGDVPEALDDFDHLLSFCVTDFQVGRGDTAQDVRERRKEARPSPIETIQLADDAADRFGVAVIRSGLRLCRRGRIPEPEEIEYAHREEDSNSAHGCHVPHCCIVGEAVM